MVQIGRRNSALPFCAADLTGLPVRSATVAAIVCWYAVIHLDGPQRAAAYREFARVLRPGGHALIAFHISAAGIPVGGATALTEWWGQAVDLTFRYLDPEAEARSLAEAGLALVARLDREPNIGVPPAGVEHVSLEHASRRSYLLVRRP
ncbi:MAG: class I SAM-dependent methyltransferase [Frankia sp.]